MYGYFNMQRAPHSHSKDTAELKAVNDEKRGVLWQAALCNPHILFSVSLFVLCNMHVCLHTRTHTHTLRDVRLALCQGNRSASAKWGIRRLRA